MAHRIGYTGITLVVKDKEKERFARLAKKEGTTTSALGRKLVVEWCDEKTKRKVKLAGETK